LIPVSNFDWIINIFHVHHSIIDIPYVC